jgi:hypothetical protein
VLRDEAHVDLDARRLRAGARLVDELLVDERQEVDVLARRAAGAVNRAAGAAKGRA